MFDDNFLKSLPDDPILAADALCDEFSRFDAKIKKHTTEDAGGQQNVLAVLSGVQANPEYHDQYVVALAAFQAYSESKDLSFDYPRLSTDKSVNIQAIRKFFFDTKLKLTADVANLTLARAKTKYSVYFGGVFAYEFSQGDLDRVQKLINMLREEINNATKLEIEHRQRLLKRLENLQGELHKRLSDLDRFWGLVGDAGVVLGKLGNDAKPIVERIKEITEIIWRTQSRSEELPTDAKPALLENSEEMEDDI